MSDEFNFEMTTKYKPEFKSQATPEQLLKQLALERVANEGRKIIRDELYDSLLDEIEKMREIVFRKNKCSVKYNLNKKLHIDIDIYSAKSDEENFNVLKLLRLIVKSNRYEGMETSKSISIIKLIDKPSLDHTDYAHSMYEKHFRDIIDEIRPAVNEADFREETVNWIHSLWENIHDILDKTTLEEIQLQQGDLQAINQRLKSILDYLDKEKIAQLQRPNESIIDTFYNILISSRIIAEIEDMRNVVYTYQNEEIVPQEITNLSLDKLFSEPATSTPLS